MRYSRTLSSYFAREIALYGVLCLFALTMVLVSQNALRRFGDLIAVGVTAQEFLTVVGYLLPMLVAYALPLSFLFGVFFAVGRLSSHGELIAMRASGLGLSSLLVPAMMLGLTASLATGYVMINLEHRVHRELRILVERLAARGGMLEAGRFSLVQQRIFYVSDRDRGNNLRGVMISDSTNKEHPFTIFAERGLFSYDEDKLLFRLHLAEGTVHLDPPPDDVVRSHRISFDELDYEFDVKALIDYLQAAVRPRQMRSDELIDVVDRAREGRPLGLLDQHNPVEYELELHRRFAMPFAPILFALMAVPIGLSRAGGSSLRGILVSLLLAFFYYGLFSQARLLAIEGWVAPALSLWLPNGVFLMLGIGLVIYARKPRR